MAIQRVDGYVYSCAGCGAVYHRRRRRGDAMQDELDHHRAVDDGACPCPMIGEHRHHSTVCEPSHLRPPATDSGTALPAGTP